MQPYVFFLSVALLVSACGPRTMQVRLKDAERQAQRAEARLDEAQRAADALEPEQLQKALDAAKRELNDRDFSLAPGAHEYLDRYNELVGRVPTVKQDREHRDLVVRIEAVKAQLAPKVLAVSDAQTALPMNAPTTAAITTIELKVGELNDAIAPQQQLLLSTPESSQWTRAQQDLGAKALEAAARGKKGVTFLDGPVASWRDALALQAAAKDKPTPAEKEQALLSAKEKLTACTVAAKAFNDDKSLSAVAFVMPEGKAQTPAQLGAACTRALKPVEADLKAAKKKAGKK